MLVRVVRTREVSAVRLLGVSYRSKEHSWSFVFEELGHMT